MSGKNIPFLVINYVVVGTFSPSCSSTKSGALPPFRKRKQNPSTTKDNNLQQRLEKENAHIRAIIATTNTTMQS